MQDKKIIYIFHDVSIANWYEQDKKFRIIDKRLDRHTEMLLDHEARLKRIEENMATKDDVKAIMNISDMIVTRLDRSDTELLMTTHRTEDLDNRVLILEETVAEIVAK